MGKTSRAIMAGVGAGLTTFGQGMARKIEQDAANERVDARLEKEDAFKERQLSIQERESKMRVKAMETQAFFDRTKIKQAKFVESLLKTDGNIPAQAELFSNKYKDGNTYTNNPLRAQEISEETGKPVFAVWELSHKVEKASGEFEIDPTTGKPMEKRSPFGEQVFYTQDEYESWKVKRVSGDMFLAHEVRQITANEAAENAKVTFNWMANTKKGKAEQAKIEAETGKIVAQEDESKARAEKLRAEAADTGKTSNLGKIREQGFNQFANNLTKELGVSVSPDTAKKIASISDNDNNRKLFRDGVLRALDPEDTGVTRSDFIEQGIAKGLPREFMERFYRNAETSYEERSEEIKKLGSDEWFGATWDAFLGFFTQ